jgi:hypothetical protein
MGAAMKVIFASALLALCAATLPASAQRGNGSPWCVQETGRGSHGMAPDCRFATRAQCEETARGIGYCMQNPSNGRRR